MNWFKAYKWSFIVTIVAVVSATIYSGLGSSSVEGWVLAAARGLLLTVVLCLMEISLSFDNAVLNASILKRMNPFWQKMFLTVGIVIAVFFMRLVFPILIVIIATGLGPVEVWNLAMERGDPHDVGTYGYYLTEAHPVIAAFGGMFLLMLFLEFVFEDREIKWLKPIEGLLAKAGQVEKLAVVIALAALALSVIPLEDVQTKFNVLFAGILGLGLFVLIKGIANALDEWGQKLANEASKAGVALFLYLELIDASLSFDGVIGAFAITTDPILIMLGLLSGAMFVRSFTVNLVRKGTLNELVHLEHGAHWAIGALAVILFISINVHVNEFITGGIGILFIVAAFITSKRYQKRAELAEANNEEIKSSV